MRNSRSRMIKRAVLLSAHCEHLHMCHHQSPTSGRVEERSTSRIGTSYSRGLMSKSPLHKRSSMIQAFEVPTASWLASWLNIPSFEQTLWITLIGIRHSPAIAKPTAYFTSRIEYSSDQRPRPWRKGERGQESRQQN